MSVRTLHQTCRGVLGCLGRRLRELVVYGGSSGWLIAAPLIVQVDPSQRHQTIDGFGCSINAWTAPHYRLYYDDSFTEFVVNELGLSVFRLQMWGGVSPREIEDWREISHDQFRWTGEGLRGKMNVDWARRLVSANPEVKIIGSVWSAPAWMKANGSRTGTRAGFLLDRNRDYDHDNRLRDDRYHHFAKWVVEWARYMETQGTPFYALSLQNELMFTQWFESTLYTPEEYARVVQVTGEMFEREGVRKPRFFGPEDMTFATYADRERHRPYVDALLQPEVARHFDAFATHGYSDGVQADARNNAVAYWRGIQRFGRPYWITEGGSGAHEWPAPVTAGIAPRLHVALAEANVSLFTGWQLVANPGEADSHHFMEWDRPTPKTYATMHYWRHVRPGAVRVEASAHQASDVLVTAFVHEQRREAVTILINPTAEAHEVELSWPPRAAGQWQAWQTTAERDHEPIACDVRSGGLRLLLPGHSITTTRALFESGPRRREPIAP